MSDSELLPNELNMDSDEIGSAQSRMRKQENELIRHRLSFLPALKQEIQYYLKLSQTNRQTINLKKSLSVLEQLPDISDDLNTEKMKIALHFFGEFERAKSAARMEILTIRTNHELGIKDWRIGRQAIRNGQGVKAGAFDVVYLWGANIVPDTHADTFQLPARISLAHCASEYRVAFGLATSMDDFSNSMIKIEFPENWMDPLVNSLRSLDLFPAQGKSHLSLNGIFYELHTHSWIGQNSLEFFNPGIADNAAFAEIEFSLFRVAEMAIIEKGHQPEKDFLDIWRKFVVKSKNA